MRKKGKLNRWMVMSMTMTWISAGEKIQNDEMEKVKLQNNLVHLSQFFLLGIYIFLSTGCTMGNGTTPNATSFRVLHKTKLFRDSFITLLVSNSNYQTVFLLLSP